MDSRCDIGNIEQLKHSERKLREQRDDGSACMASDDRNVDEVRRNVKSGRDEGGGTNGIEKSYSEESIVCIDSTPIVHFIEKRKNRIDGVCDEEHFGFRTISGFTKEIEQRTDCSSLLAEDLPWHS